MSAQPTIEQRLSALEAAMGEIQSRLEEVMQQPCGLEQVKGSISNPEAFEEAMNYARAMRLTDHHMDDDPHV